MRRSTATTLAFLFHHADTESAHLGVVLMPVSIWWPSVLPLYSISVNKKCIFAPLCFARVRFRLL